MTERDRADLESIAQRLKAIHDELNGLELRIGASPIEQAGLSIAMALAWIELFWKMEESPSE
jgi:phage portal protein BeeE